MRAKEEAAGGQLTYRRPIPEQITPTATSIGSQGEGGGLQMQYDGATLISRLQAWPSLIAYAQAPAEL